MNNITASLAGELALEKWQVQNILALFEEGATVPFVARYRKERTGNLDEVRLLEFQKAHRKILALEERRAAILESLAARDLLTSALERSLREATTLATLEDLYLPFRPKRKTRAAIAAEKGLEPLAKMLMAENLEDPFSTAGKFVSQEKDIPDADEALQGARDIMAEWISERVPVRHRLRRLFEKEAELASAVKKGKEEEGENFRAYFDWREPAMKAPSHRLLAIFRGEKEGFLKVEIAPDKEKAVSLVTSHIIGSRGEAARQKEMAVRDAISRLLFPAMERELRTLLKTKADEKAVAIFSENLRQLLLAPPLGQKNILALDPGFRTGCKLVCLDKTGRLLYNDTIYPHPPRNEKGQAMKKLRALVNAYDIEAIAVGNGTAGRETEELLTRTRFDRDLVVVMVNESGASVYSASKVARDEFPEYDVTVRGAVSIGRRLADPLAELVKIDPKAIGVGQYQHDVDQKLLQESLATTVSLCVNRVGVEVNTASRELLSYVSGIGPKLAAGIVSHRNTNGNFQSREELKEVKGMGERSFQQSAGFLRIRDGSNPLDASAVHPENYQVVQKMARNLKVDLPALIGNSQLIAKLDPNAFVTPDTGLPTITDILKELEKPGRDPRNTFSEFKFNKEIRTINDIKPGMVLPAIVTNITAFGAFVDLGIHESGLIHKSKIAPEFVSDPAAYLRINQKLEVKVLEVDTERKRIALSLVDL